MSSYERPQRPGHCCPTLRAQLDFNCPTHADPYDCPDQLVAYAPSFQEFGLIVHDGGRSMVVIAFCPWCGSALPVSQRDRWFDELERVGIEDPREAPPMMRTQAWLVGGAPEQGPGRINAGMTAGDAESLAAAVRADTSEIATVAPDGEFFCVEVSSDRGVYTLYDELDWRWLRPQL